ncbi:OmpA family protein [bacterium]|nr:OmpA family protein [bacterium]
MDRNWPAILLSVILVGILAGDAVWFLQKYKPLGREMEKVRGENDDLRKEITGLQQSLTQQVSELSRAQQEKTEEVSRLQAAKDSLAVAMQDEIRKREIEITQLADQLKVSITDKILFASGESDISPAGVRVLRRVGDVLKNVRNKNVRVEGHTDNDPMRGRLRARMPTNWELSTARATNVVRFLQEKIGMDPKRLEAVGLGQYRPVASNATEAGKAQNRRIEIFLQPIR